MGYWLLKERMKCPGETYRLFNFSFEFYQFLPHEITKLLVSPLYLEFNVILTNCPILYHEISLNMEVCILSSENMFYTI